MPLHFLSCFCIPCRKLHDGNPRKKKSKKTKEGKNNLLRNEEIPLDNEQVNSEMKQKTNGDEM